LRTVEPMPSRPALRTVVPAPATIENRTSANACNVLRAAVLNAIDVVGDAAAGSAVLEDMLREFVATVGPVQQELTALAQADPLGSLVLVLQQLRNAFAHAAAGDTAATLSALITARAFLVRLGEPEDATGPADGSSRWAL
jgi:hypothetical protein